MTYKRTQVVMLPTNEKAAISINKHRKMFINNYSDTINYNLYFLSDEEIKEGDWYIDNSAGLNNIYQASKLIPKDKDCKKIIATTDNFLEIGVNNCDGCLANKALEKGYLHRMGTDLYPDYMSCQKDKYISKLPQPSQEFIELFVKEYNKDSVIEWVDVEYQKYCCSPGSYQKKNLYGDCDDCKENQPLQLKVNSKNEITIRKIKDSWSKEEVEDALVKHYLNIGSTKGCNLGQDVRVWTKKWISENL